MFTYEFKYGNKENVLREPNTLVLTEEIAEKYFGDENPVGLSILVNQEDEYIVSAVSKKLPRNSVYSFKILFPWEPWKKIFKSNPFHRKSLFNAQIKSGLGSPIMVLSSAFKPPELFISLYFSPPASCSNPLPGIKSSFSW